MKLEDKLSEAFEREEVPDELLPRNIAAMLRNETEARRPKGSGISAQRRNIIVRTSAAAAACAVFAAGVIALRDSGNEQEQLEAPIAYEAISPDSYDALYNIYTGISLSGGEEPDSDLTVGEAAAAKAADGEYPAGDFTDGDASDADIVKIDGNYMYSLNDSTISIIALDTMEVVSGIESELDPPVEIYAENGKLIVISKETEAADSGIGTAVTEAPQTSRTEDPETGSGVPAQTPDTYQSTGGNSGSPDEAAPDGEAGLTAGNGKSAISGAKGRTNAVVEIYDTSDPADPARTTFYKQNGSYVSSKLADGVLYLATAYSDYRVKPLDTQDDLDSFVPAYYLNGEKSYLAAEDIIVPSGAASTDYTVISAIRTDSGEASVKAVLGSSRNVYCSADTLYVAAAAGREYSVISAFDLSDGEIRYRASGSVEGAVLGCQSMNEYGGLFRIATETTDGDGGKAVSVYVLDRSLTVVNSAGQLFPGGKASAVRFEKNYARIIDESTGESVLVLDLSTNPPTLAQSLMGGEAYLYAYSDDLLLGVGRSDSGLTLTMYSSETGLAVDGTVLEGEEDSRALTDRRAVLLHDGLIGVPASSVTEFGIKNSYYVYSYGDGGFEQKGVIEYLDVDDSMVFTRGAVVGDTLYVTGGGRIISARLSDLKIIGTYEY